MTQPKISAEAWEQAVSDFVKEAPKHLRAQSMYDSAWIKQRARGLTSAQPAAGNDAVRALQQLSSELTKQWNRCNDATYTMSDVIYAIREALDDALRTALAANQKEKT